MATFFGLDIGSSEVKVLQAEKVNQGFKLLNFASVSSINKEPAEAIKLAIKEAGIKGVAEVNVALAESDVYTRIVSMPRLSAAELTSSIQYEAEQYVPVALTEVELYHQVLKKPDDDIDESKVMEVLLIAVTKKRIDQLMTLLDQANLIPRSLETELFSLKRVFTDINKSQLLISFGHQTTDLIILEKGVPLFLHSFASGGIALTKTMANELSLTFEQAEQYKRTYGLRENLLEGKVAKLLTPLIDEVIKQINKAFVFIQQSDHKQPEQMIISGGGALLPGLSGYLANKFNLEVVVGNPLNRFVKDEEFSKKIAQESNPQLTTVTGLALKGWL